MEKEKNTRELELENKIKTLEKENIKLNLEKKHNEITTQIAEYKELIKANLEVSQRLLAKEIITNNSSYLDNNKNMEEKIRSWEKELAEIEKLKNDLETKERIIGQIEQK
jgi:hypothetical protein